MNYLAIDTSGSHLTVIAKRGDGKGEHVYFNENCALRHSVELMNAIDQTLKNANLLKEEVDVFCAVIGPGSFTGIRIGISTAKALAYALKKKVLAVTSFDVLAYNMITADALALVDAKHSHAYTAGYSKGKVDLPPAYTDLAEINELGKGRKIVYSSKIDGIDGEIVSLTDGLKNAVNAKLYEATDDLDALFPLYIRKSQAEEGR